MALSKHGLKALGLCALVLGLMTFGTGAAHAEKLAHWNVAGKAIASGLLPFLKVKTIEELKSPEAGKHLVLLTKIIGLLYHVLCTGAETKEFHFLLEGGSLGKLRFSGCKALLSEKTSAACEPKTGTEKGVVETLLLKDLIVLGGTEGKETLDELVPNAGETFATLESSEECAVGEKIPVKGKFFIKDCLGKFSEELVDHLIEESSKTHLFVLSDTAEHAAKIDGSVVVALTGAHEGLKWSGTPG